MAAELRILLEQANLNNASIHEGILWIAGDAGGVVTIDVNDPPFPTMVLVDPTSFLVQNQFDAVANLKRVSDGRLILPLK